MIIKKLRILAMLGMLYLAFPFLARAQVNSAFDRGSYITKTDTLAYRILFPKKFDPNKKYPLIIVLHGAGERGNDNEAQIKYGPELFLNDTIRQNYPAIVVFPQCPANGFWSNVKIDKNDLGKYVFHFQEGGEPTKVMGALLGLVDQFLDKPFVSKKQVYIGGLSMGGMGTFEILRRKPNTFAAAFAICGGDNTNNVSKYAKKVPLWIFHGQKDSVVPFDHSQVVVDALKAAGANPKFTIYPNDDHNSWDDAFAEPQLIPWLFSHSK
ncbi:prolyl oligopeptidase family serine peptidase [Mucilaginibacter sp. 5C4]|uniref:carboxylesterase family protein n=1 Tax=Mucilaginibacter sp. 5C4 TaxID=3048589 RepID=UPI002AC90C0F|nr:prolyl oligopeptidase family serine peptidase [Mucilaginibacter sp. 5C4]MEB0303037.1 prolyl oligopeptidase family serine peptidase [Mucilaginibacter sp. 5C4]WPX24406.1 prolyl oligopeptidase family serine peptidase [Mucilaginibacter sp. 5C4]